MTHNDQDLRSHESTKGKPKAEYRNPEWQRLTRAIWREVLPQTEALLARSSSEPLHYGHREPGLRTKWGTR